MTVLDIRQEGDPVLREKAAWLPEITDEVRQLARDMLETLRAARAVGLAAPQVGRSMRLIVLKASPEIMANPVICRSEGSQRVNDGCLSVAHGTKFLFTTRAQMICVSYRDLDGNVREAKLKGYLAAIVQHEIDHLDGILFTDRWREQQPGARK